MNTLIIAEAGVNHNGNLELAKKMALEAKKAGADIVKYQTAVPKLVISKFAEKATYQKEQTGDSESQLEMCERIHFDFEAHKDLKNYCDEIGIQYLSAAFDLPSVEFLQTLDLPMVKVPSGEITNLPYLEKIGAEKKAVLLSTGMSNMDEIETAIKILKKSGCGEVLIMHCNTQYPTPDADANLRAMLKIRQRFGCRVGYSDHTNGITAPIIAVAYGADAIEKHFTLDKNMEGPDHKASLDVQELTDMVREIRRAELMLGNGEKVVSESEKENIKIARKSIVALHEIKAGDKFTENNIMVKRPAGGISPMDWNKVVGKVAKRSFAEDEMIEL